MKSQQNPALPIFDPRSLGSKCDECPLRDRTPVPARTVDNPRLVVVAESPGRGEELAGEPLVGASGYYLRRSLKRFGVPEEAVFKTNAVLCRPPKKLKPNEWAQALACCRPRLELELAEISAPILAVGGKALAQLTDKPDAIIAWRGAPVAGRAPFDRFHIVPTVHPAYVIRGHDEWDPVFRTDLQRALRPELCEWTWPESIVTEGPQMEAGLRQILASGLPVGLDVETAGIDPLSSGLLCIGLATSEVAVSVPWPPQSDELRRLVVEVLVAPHITKVLHNAQYDLLALKHCGGIDVAGEIFDTLLAHAVVALQLPHNLGLVASCEFPAPRWKSEFRDDDEEATKSGDDFGQRDPLELRTYNLRDAYMTALLHPVMCRRISNTHRGWELYSELYQLSDLAMRMRERGVLVNKPALEKHRAALNAAMERKREEFYRLCPLNHVVRGKELKTRSKVYVGPYRLGANGAHEDIRRLFFNRLGLQVIKRTEEGLASIDDETLQTIILRSPPEIRDIARCILDYRQFQKTLSVYIDGLPISKDGCVHPCWKGFGTKTGRMACQDPNAQNMQQKIRDILMPRPGMHFVGADWRQLEPKISAMLTEDEKLLEWYNVGLNVYLQTARSLWGPEIAKDSKEYKVAKSTILGMNYGGGAETLWRNMLRKGQYVAFDTVRKVIEFYFNEHPAVKQYQLDKIEEAEAQKFTEGPISGRRIYYHLGQIEPTKAANFEIQDSAAAIKNKAILKIDKLLRWDKGEAIVLDVHDEIILEGPDPKRLADILRSCMEQDITLNGHTLSFPVDVEASSEDWGHMKALA